MVCYLFRTESKKVRAERKFGDLGRIKEKIASEGVSRHAPTNRCLQEPDNEMEKIAMNPQEKIFHKRSRLGLKGLDKPVFRHKMMTSVELCSR